MLRVRVCRWRCGVWLPPDAATDLWSGRAAVLVTHSMVIERVT